MIWLIDIINIFGRILIWMLAGRAILSWFMNPYTAGRMGFFSKLYPFLVQVTEPLIVPARRLLARFNTGPIDLSLFVTILFIVAIQNILIRVLVIFM
ncbi:MAG: YggT family protein [Clostridiales Family XIII bacterium]|jgi:uncharacterized protein YggT (Ycf19 family)|nr:YggT family protein [Clostridiales Family XIII bacterium]